MLLQKVVTDFSNFRSDYADATAGTEVAYRSCAYLSFGTVIPGGKGTPWNSWWGCTDWFSNPDPI